MGDWRNESQKAVLVVALVNIETEAVMVLMSSWWIARIRFWEVR